MQTNRLCVGLDLDNTLVCYDDLMHQIAIENGWVPDSTPADKTVIRNTLRLKDGGQQKWELLQAQAHGPQIHKAHPMESVLSFLSLCKDRGIRACIVSHKTMYAAAAPGQTNLRTAALSWLSSQGFFSTDSPLTPSDVFFEDTAGDKAARVKELGCTHFIDDLEETFRQPMFPPEVEKLLFSPRPITSAPPFVKTFSHWKDIAHYFSQLSE